MHFGARSVMGSSRLPWPALKMIAFTLRPIVVVERPFGQRMLGTGNLVVQSSDRTTPEIRVTEIRADVKELYEQLRRATETEKQRRGVRLVDME